MRKVSEFLPKLSLPNINYAIVLNNITHNICISKKVVFDTIHYVPIFLFDSFAIALAIGGMSRSGHEQSVEILSSDLQIWKLGPRLPRRISGAVALQAPNGGVILIGGFFH